ncbi:hypothetical protein [Nonomuraea sp. 10N515B]|uniref:hypothetical protein n=1 Tax=Nonomuraea sp. 10N515B TaxID=3457422 RepID=UPI003FCDDEAB
MVLVRRTILLIGCALMALSTVMSWAALPQGTPGAFPIFLVGTVLAVVGGFSQLLARKDGEDDRERDTD